tara:strand:- start:11315 stop:12211 length:897 start_codon:yes stop_codon:yes gene_type:complete
VLRNFVSLLGVLYLIIPTVSFFERLTVDKYIEWEWIQKHSEKLRELEAYQFSFTFLLFGVVFLVGFYLDGIKKHRLSDIAGIWGLIITCFCFGLMYWWDFTVWFLLLSSWLTIYCFIIPIVEYFSKKVGETNWEKAFIVSVPSLILLYIAGYNADILLSNSFGIDPSHFSYTKPVASLVFLAPFIFIGSFFLVLFLAAWVVRKSGDENPFRQFVGFFSAIILFTFSFVLWGNGSKAIEQVAVIVDFNPNSVCALERQYDGFIYLDPVYNLVFVYDSNAVDKEDKYFITECNPGRLLKK